MPSKSPPQRPSSVALAGPEASSIKVVSELTALPMGTLRAWERRYGFPKPERREGSNRRVYSSAQVERLRAVARALERGYRPGDVIRMPLNELSALLDGTLDTRSPPGGSVIADVPTFIEFLEQDKAKRIDDELRLAAAALGAKRFVVELAQPLAIAVGKAWEEGRIEIRQEHLMTECLTTQLRALLATHQVANGEPTVVLTTLPGEPHTLGLQMVALYLALGAARPRLLGASTPPDQVIAAAHAFGAQVVGIALTPAADLASARRDLQRLARSLPSSTALWLGGAGAGALGKLPERVETIDSWAALDAALARARATDT
ncbi:MAG TPA: MerR family transcriptional regulator [Polyangiaceae bacterium]|nr:MerR family transcriptional regulator [Polyangiaceae bacterium]